MSLLELRSKWDHMLKFIEWILFSDKCQVEREIEGNRKKREGKRKRQIMGTTSKIPTASTSWYKSNIAFTEATTQATSRDWPTFVPLTTNSSNIMHSNSFLSSRDSCIVFVGNMWDSMNVSLIADILEVMFLPYFTKILVLLTPVSVGRS